MFPSKIGFVTIKQHWEFDRLIKSCTQLAYKAEWKGRTFIKAERFYPSRQIRSAYGHRDGKKALDIHEWTCPACDTIHDRDIKASKNLLVLAK